MKLFRGRAALAAALMGAAALAACDGSRNPFQPRPGPGPDGGGNPAADSTRPAVQIVLPDTQTDNVAVGDSLFVRARVTDNTMLASVQFDAYAVRGSEVLGTATRVDRFTTKTVDLRAAGRVVRDTTLDRFLYATADTLPEAGIYVVVTAADTAGNTASDTFRVNLGGPRVTLAVEDDEAFAGTQLTVTVTAADTRDLIQSVLLTGTGAMQFQMPIQLPTALPSVDTTLVIPIPIAARGAVTLTATAVSGSNLVGAAPQLSVTIREPQQDQVPPKTTFSFQIPERVEQQDSFTVQVSGADENRVDSVGVTVLAILRDQTPPVDPPDTLRIYVGRGQVTGGTFRFAFADLGLDPHETFEVDLEVTAWSRDVQGNCGAATRENTPQELPCTVGAGGIHLSSGTGRLVRVFLARGLTIDRPGPTGQDVVADLVADSNFIYLSNYSRNRVELLPVGGTVYGRPVQVGSKPWGLALGRFRDSLYVANSGGTNISVIPLGGAVLNEAEGARIFTVNERLFSVLFDPLTGEVGVVRLHDYSDRPQFLAQASNGLLVYSTAPTPAAEDGTVRLYDPRKLRSDIFIGYVDRHEAGRAIVVNADSAFQVPPSFVMVCPRRRLGDTTDPQCITGFPAEVSDSLTKLRSQPPNAQGQRYDTRLDLGADIEDVGFADTTFVASSTNRRFVAVGEGVRTNARIPMFEAVGDSLVSRGDVRDLISNAADRVIGLGLNFDGSLGAARGDKVYFFNSALRQQGEIVSGSPAGGVALHPDARNYPLGTQRLGFVSGLDNGRPFVDVIDAFHFELVKRIYIRDPVVGALVVAPRAPGDPAFVNLRLYALTSTGILSLPIINADLP
ncbi:MAG TPA: hypothetical protein VHG08_03690 [Longimicrobium sp.]|nr:hypothetical protein [Longimicrobium sp.]